APQPPSPMLPFPPAPPPSTGPALSRPPPSPTTTPPAPAAPVPPPSRPAAAQAKPPRQHDEYGRPHRSFRGLLDHLATLTRNQIRFAGTSQTIPMLAEPTSTQREAFDLIGAPIPLTLN